MQKLTLDEIKKTELEILKDIDCICRTNKIEYSLAFGTLLGAIRHKGFIPWDDDIDIMMTRHNYEKFLEKYMKEKDENYILLTHELNKSYYHQFAKVVDKRTRLKEDNLKEISDMGVWVDVFPVDSISSRFLKIKLKFLDFYQIGLKRAKGNIKTSKRKKIVKLVKKIIYIDRLDYWYKKTINIIKNTNKKKNNDLRGVLLTDFPKKYLFSGDMFKNYKDIEFEKNKFRIITNYDENLKKIYGDYMKLPPLEERVPHHNVEMYIKEKK